MKQYDAITLFPEMFAALTEWGVTGRARETGHYGFASWNPRDFAANAYRTVDDRPYGGGPGMVMMPGPMAGAIRTARARQSGAGVVEGVVVYLSPQGRRLDQALVEELVAKGGMILACGRYEGVDERVIRREIDLEVSIGDYVLSGGELAAMVLLDSVIRQLPGVLGDAESARQDSFATGLLDCPHYTRPESFEGERVPDVLLSGNHADIERWRLKESLGRTWARRPDLLERRPMTARERALLDEFQREHD